jgi:hypothetical protein
MPLISAIYVIPLLFIALGVFTLLTWLGFEWQE